MAFFNALFYWRTLTCAVLSLLLPIFAQFYCIIYRDKRFPFNINVKFIANMKRKELFIILHRLQTEWHKKIITHTFTIRAFTSTIGFYAVCVFIFFFIVVYCITFVLYCAWKSMSHWTTAASLNEADIAKIVH